jgi:hypothetical protein
MLAGLPALTPYEIGSLIGSSIFGLIPLFFLIRAFQAGSGSTRLANLSLALGLACLVMPERSLGISPSNDPGLYRLIGTLRLLAGLAGIALGVAALVRRRRDRTGVVRPLLGGLFSVIHVMIGLGYFLFAFQAQGGLLGEAEPWTHVSTDHGVSVTLPSKNWQVFRGKNGKEFYVDRFNRMQASILASTPQTLDEFRAATDSLKRTFPKEDHFLEPPEMREGETEAGNPYLFFQGRSRAAEGDGAIFVARSLVWCRDKGTTVDLIFEAVPRMASQVGRESEKSMFEKAASTISLSVR